MITHPTEDILIAEQAAEWIQRLPTASLKERTEFVRWLKRSPKHVREVLLVMLWDKQLRSSFPRRSAGANDRSAAPLNNVIWLHRHRINGGRVRSEQSPGSSAVPD